MNHRFVTDDSGRTWCYLNVEAETPRLRLEAALSDVLRPTGVTLAQVRGESRKADVCAARWLLMHHLVSVMGKSSAEAGRILNKDHTAVLYGIAKVHFGLTGEAMPILLKRSKRASAKPYANVVPPSLRRCSLAA